MRGRTRARKHCRLESGLDVEGVAKPELIDQVEGRGAAGEHDVLSAVDLMAIHLEGRRLAAEQTGPLVEVDAPPAPGEREPGGEAREPRPHNRDTRLPAHTAASHERAITPSFAAFESRARPRSGRSGAASIRSRIPR